MRRCLLLLAFLAIPQMAIAQTAAFRALLGGYVSYRPTAAWRVTRTVIDSHGEGVLLAPRAVEDSGVSALLMAYRRPADHDVQAFADSIVTALSPSPAAHRSTAISTDSTRVILWSSDSPAGPVFAIDRVAILPKALVYARITMRSVPPAKPEVVPFFLERIDDLLTTVHAEGRVLFPAGAGFGIKLY